MSQTAAPVVNEPALAKLHSIVRWDKPIEEVDKAAQEAGANAFNQADSKTGNTTIHIAAQNGHYGLVDHLIKKGVYVNVPNLKGNTALHMAVEYDMYKISKLLRDNGASDIIENSEGSKAINGLSNTKLGDDAWDSPLTILKSTIDDPADIKEALDNLRKAAKDGKAPEKGALVMTGMQKKKLFKHWDHAAFQDIVRSL